MEVTIELDDDRIADLQEVYALHYGNNGRGEIPSIFEVIDSHNDRSVPDMVLAALRIAGRFTRATAATLDELDPFNFGWGEDDEPPTEQPHQPKKGRSLARIAHRRSGRRLPPMA